MKAMPVQVIDRDLKFTGPFTPRSKTDTIVLHHAAAKSCTVEDVHRWHLNNGWLGIGYHYFVSKLGGIYQGRPEDVVGAHAGGHNDHTIGICAEGDFEQENMPVVQQQAIRDLVQWIVSRYPGVNIKRHKDLNATLCPGKNYPFDEIVAGAVSDTPILGQAQATVEQARAWLKAKAPDWVSLADLYYAIAPAYGVRADVALAQAAKETGFFKFGGLVQPWQNNFCGLGATGTPSDGNTPLRGADPNKVRFEKSVHGAIFVDEATGVEAHIQHLYAYATNEPLPEGALLVDPRFILVQKGTAPYVEYLGAAENPAGVGWAYPGHDYGRSIVKDYLVGLLATQAPVAEEINLDEIRKEITALKGQVATLAEKQEAVLATLSRMRDALMETEQT